MRRIASVAAALVVLSAPSVFAAVKITQGVAIGNAMLTVTSQREVNILTAPGRPARLMGRLPRSSSSLVSDGMAAWAVTTGERRPMSAGVRVSGKCPASVQAIPLRDLRDSFDGSGADLPLGFRGPPAFYPGSSRQTPREDTRE